MVGILLVWLLSFFVLICLLGLFVYQLICLADLEFDCINPYDAATRVNKLVLPEYFTQGGIVFSFYSQGIELWHCWVSLSCTTNTDCEYVRKQHLVDVTEIFNLLSHEKKVRLFKLGYLVILLFLSLFWMIVCAPQEEL